jgi:urea transporter
VRRLCDLALLVVQWALVLSGLFTMVVSLHFYSVETSWLRSLPEPSPGQDTYFLPSWPRLVQGMTTGIISIGLGAALFYLRRLYLARRA